MPAPERHVRPVFVPLDIGEDLQRADELLSELVIRCERHLRGRSALLANLHTALRHVRWARAKIGE